MRLSKPLTRWAAAAALAISGASASAAAVTLNLQGSITGYEFIDLSALGLTTGSAVSLSLTFNETFSDGSYSFADSPGPVSGVMTVGNIGYVFGDADPFVYSYNLPSGAVNWVELQFLGNNPSLGGADFFGLFASFTPALTLYEPLLLGYGFTTDLGGGFSSTSYGYAVITPDSYSITPALGTVPVPATLPLVVTALLGAGWVRQRGAVARPAASPAPMPA